MKHKCSKWLCFVGVFLVAGCARKPSVPSDSAVFRDVAAQSGITFRHDNGARGDHRFIEVLPGGVGVIDFDGDGRRDLVFVQSGPSTTDRSAFLEPTVRIYRNMGDFRFSEATRELGLEGDYGYGQGVAVADVDGDGWSDLLVTSLRGNRLFLNRSGKRFEDATKSWGLERLHSTGYATSAVFGDIDHDGRPDLFVCYYAPWSEDREIACRTAEFPDYCPPDRYPPDTNQLFRNTGRGFVDVSASAGIQRTPGRSLVASLRDLDGDGNTDILVGTDLTGNQVWLGNGKGRFREAGSEMGLARMASAWLPWESHRSHWATMIRNHCSSPISPVLPTPCSARSGPAFSKMFRPRPGLPPRPCRGFPSAPRSWISTTTPCRIWRLRTAM